MKSIPNLPVSWKRTPPACWLCVILLLATAPTLVLSGCSGDDAAAKGDKSASFGAKSTSSKEPRARFGNIESKGFDVTRFDLNADGQNDQFHYLRNGTLARIERDLNFDGLADCYEHYKAGELFEEELDLDLDGTIDVVRFYKNGLITSKRYAIGFRADMVVGRWYDELGALVRVERDTTGDTRVDTWEYFESGAQTPFKIEVDSNSDGKPDRTLTPEASGS